MKNSKIITSLILIGLLASIGQAFAQVKLRSDPSGDDKDYISKDLVLKAGQKGTITQGDDLYRLLFESKTLVLDYTIRDTATPIPPDPVKPTPISLTGMTSVYQPGTGGSYTTTARKLDGLKTIKMTYALAPGGNPVNTTVTLVAGTVTKTYTLVPTANWSTSTTFTGEFPAVTGTFPVTIRTNRGLTLPTILIE